MPLSPTLSRRAVLANLAGALVAPEVSLAARSRSLAGTVDAFGDLVCAQLAAQAPGKNVMLAPPNLHSLLLLLNAGADTATQKLAQESALLAGTSTARANEQAQLLAAAISKSASDKIAFKSVTAVWVPQSRKVRPAFAKVARESFGAAVLPVDFAAPGTLGAINDWVANATERKIEGIVEQLDAKIDFLLATAMFFKGQWNTAFDPKATKPGRFVLRDGSAKDVPMMAASLRAGYREDGDVRAAALDFGSDDGPVQFVILQSARQGDIAPLSKLRTAQWIGTAKFETIELELRMPKLKTNFKADVETALKGAGLGFVFDPKSRFNGIVGAGASDIDVAHAVSLEVDEQGAQATAASVVSASRSAQSVVKFDIDRSFAFAIYDRAAKVVLLQGRIEDPAI